MASRLGHNWLTEPVLSSRLPEGLSLHRRRGRSDARFGVCHSSYE